MTDATARTVTADILVLAVPAYATRAARDQLALREGVNAALAAAIAPIAPADRIVVDTSDGAAVVFLGDPGDAAHAASALRTWPHPETGANALPVSAGLNRGPVQLDEADGMIGVAGDGIAVAEKLAGFAQPGQIVVSRAFRDAAGASGKFQPLGTRNDETLRAHEIFLFDPLSHSHAATSPRGWLVRRRAALVASAAVLLLLAGGFAAREAREIFDAQRRPGVIRLAVRPVADVVVDSAYKGMAPPLQAVQVPAGRHTVELMRAGHPTRNVQVDLKPGEEIEIRHTFLEKPRPRTFWERLGL